MPFGRNRSWFNPTLEKNFIKFTEVIEEKNVEYCFIVDIASDKTQEVEKTLEKIETIEEPIIVKRKNKEIEEEQKFREEELKAQQRASARSQILR